MKRTVFFVCLLSLGLLATGLAITPQELVQRHRQALSANQELLFNLSTIRMVGQLERYGLQGDVGVFVSFPDRFAVAHEFPLFSERWVARGKDVELLEMTGWHRTAARGDLFHLRALQFILGYQYLNPGVALPTDIREAEGEVGATLLTTEGVPIRVVYDTATFLIRSFAFTGSDGLGVVMQIESYRQWDGVQLPGRLREESINPATYTFTQCEVNRGVDGSFFNIPPAPPDSNLPERSSVRLPLQRYFGLPLIKCWIGNSPALTFLIDTALPFSVIDRSIATQLGFTPQGRRVAAVRYPLGDLAFVRLPTVLLREVEYRNKLFLAANMIPASTNIQLPVHGILGADFFHQQIINLDLTTESFRITSTRGFNPEQQWARAPLLTTGGTLAVIATLNGVETAMELSTSSGESVGFSAASETARGLLRRQGPSAEAFSVGLGFGFPGTVMPLGALSLGGQTVEAPLAHLVQFPDTYPGGRRQIGWLGSGLLRRFSVHLDIPGQTAYFEPTTASREADTFNAAGLYPVRSGGKLVVQRVVPGLPAANAGIEPGDVILQLMGYPGEQIVFDRVYGFLNILPGQSVSLQIQKGDGSVLDLQLRNASAF